MTHVLSKRLTRVAVVCTLVLLTGRAVSFAQPGVAAGDPPGTPPPLWDIPPPLLPLGELLAGPLPDLPTVWELVPPPSVPPPPLSAGALMPQLGHLSYLNGRVPLLGLQEPRPSRGEQRAYERAKRALDDRRYDEALEGFREVAAQGGQNADAATYWQAWTLNKVGRGADALGKLAELRSTFPKSRWLDEAKSLEAEIRQAAGQPLRPESQADEDLKLMALNGLMHQSPENAVPLLEKFLQGTHSPKLKERALFVLAQSNTPRARDVLGQIARGQSNPDLQAKAIQYLGLHGGQESRTLLASIYKSSQDVPLKRRILQSFMLSGERSRLLEAAKSESVPELRGEAVRQLGLLGAHDELWQLYQGEQSVEVRTNILQAMFLGGSADRLIELAKAEKDPVLRRTAVRNLGLIGSEKTGAALVSIYSSDQDSTIRKDIINALFIQNNARGLIDLARKETDLTLKKAIVQKLSLMNSKEAAEFMLEILNKQ